MGLYFITKGQRSKVLKSVSTKSSKSGLICVMSTERLLICLKSTAKAPKTLIVAEPNQVCFGRKKIGREAWVCLGKTCSFKRGMTWDLPIATAFLKAFNLAIRLYAWNWPRAAYFKEIFPWAEPLSITEFDLGRNLTCQ